MNKSREYNFAGRLVQRLGENSRLIDAATGETFLGRDVPNSIIAFAKRFVAAGLNAGDRIAISCDLSPATAFAYLGAMYAGFVPVLVSEIAFANEGPSLLAKARAKAIWTRREFSRDWLAGSSVMRFHGLCEPIADAELPQPAAVAEDELAVLMPTSGSTGVPRLVMVSHGNLVANTEAIVRSQGLHEDELAMLIMPVSYCFGASVLHTHLYEGGGVVFDSRFMFPDKVLRAMQVYGCTTFAGVPTVYSILLRRSNLRAIPLPRLRRLLQAGGALAPESVREVCQMLPDAEFFAMYGQTEATARIACQRVERRGEKFGSVGVALENLTIRIVDERDCEIAPGEIGEICVQGPSVCAGYLDDPQASESKFRDGWLRTGDSGCLDEDGHIWIKGRTSDFVKIRGVRVSVGEVEAKVAAISGVYECAAKGIPHPEAGEALALFIVASPGEDGLAQRVRHALPPQWTCASVDVVPELPKTENGKIARARLGLTA